VSSDLWTRITTEGTEITEKNTFLVASLQADQIPHGGHRASGAQRAAVYTASVDVRRRCCPTDWIERTTTNTKVTTIDGESFVNFVIFVVQNSAIL